MLGKIIGGGLPAAAFGGRGDLMERLAPLGAVYQAGTLSGNPLAMAAGLATLDAARPSPGPTSGSSASRARARGRACARARPATTPVTLNRVGSMLTLFFSAGPVTTTPSARGATPSASAAFFRAALDGGVYLPPSQFEARFVSLAHGQREVEQVVAAAEAFFHQG